MILSQTRPQLVMRPVWERWKLPAAVADFTDGKRPAFRVGCHCRNCNWRGEARIPIGTKIPLWLGCPKCETLELSAHGEFLGRDEQSVEEELTAYFQRDLQEAYQEKLQ
jgi:hypothetical protein